MEPRRRTLLTVLLLLIAAGTGALAGLRAPGSPLVPPAGASPGAAAQGPTVRGALVQDKVLRGSEGTVTLALTLEGGAPPPERRPADRGVDLVVVLDGSGSMSGPKIADALEALRGLAAELAPQDRLGLVTYSDQAETRVRLRPMTEDHRRELLAALDEVGTGGSTNLGAGLQNGLDLILAAGGQGRSRRVLLISDGLANRGVTDPLSLGRMAAGGPAADAAVSTVGLGREFNEVLMTAIADQGAGTYHYLEDPAAFGELFRSSYRLAGRTAVSGLEVAVPLPPGVSLIHAGGYPVQVAAGRAVFRPGSLAYGQTRTLHLTFKVPTRQTGSTILEGVALSGRCAGEPWSTVLTERFTVACVTDPAAVLSSVRREAWAAKVLQEDFSRLKEEVADEIRRGDKDQALERIRRYREETAAVNRQVASGRVAANLEQEVGDLQHTVQETFAGAPAAIAAKQQQNAKALHYDGYQKRRDQP